MEEAWKTLAEAGLPEGAPRRPPQRLDFAAVRDAVEALAKTRLSSIDDARRAVLLAWLEAWRHHWPSAFARELGEPGDALRESLRKLPLDENRYLKLRRIAVENLSAVL